MKISCIIPVFNVEGYLRQSVGSLIRQTYQDTEIILVDDGSSDGSSSICDIFAREDARIKVIHKDNGGLSDARNVGLREATGDYVIFLDADDFWLKADALQSIIEVLKPELDFIGFNCSYYYPDSGTYSAWVSYNNSLARPTDKNTAIVELVRSGTFPMSACLKFLKRDFLIDNNLYFKKGQIAEDIPWFINLLDVTNNCCFINQYIYAYRQNVSGSITSSGGRKGFDSLFDIFKTELFKIDNRSFSEEAKRALKSFLAYEYCILLTYRGVEKAIKKELFGYRDILQYDLNPKVRIASRVNRVFGIKVTAMALSLYHHIRRIRK